MIVIRYQSTPITSRKCSSVNKSMKLKYLHFQTSEMQTFEIKLKETVLIKQLLFLLLKKMCHLIIQILICNHQTVRLQLLIIKEAALLMADHEYIVSSIE